MRGAHAGATLPSFAPFGLPGLRGRAARGYYASAERSVRTYLLVLAPRRLRRDVREFAPASPRAT